jgi:hypothetical protein
LDAESLPADLGAFDGDLHDALADAAELEQPVNLQPDAALAEPLPPLPVAGDASHRVPINAEVQAIGYQPHEDIEELLNTEGKWHGKRPRGDHWQRGNLCHWYDPKSVNKYFPPFKDKTRYGQRQVPQHLIGQYSNVRHKIAAVMGWWRMTPNQQRNLCTEISASAKDEKKLDQYLQKIEDEKATQDALWLQELRAARKWQREMDAARAEYESANPIDSAAVLSALHRINSLMEEPVASALKAQNITLNKLSVEERRARTAARAAARAAESRDDKEEQREVRIIVLVFFYIYISLLFCISMFR